MVRQEKQIGVGANNTSPGTISTCELVTGALTLTLSAFQVLWYRVAQAEGMERWIYTAKVSVSQYDRIMG